MDEILESRLKDGMELNELLASDELKSSLLEMFFPECLDMLQSSSVTGVFVILAGNDMHKAGEFDGFFIRSGHQSGQLHGSAAGKREQAFVQRVEYPAGYLLDHPFSHGGPGAESGRKVFL